MLHLLSTMKSEMKSHGPTLEEARPDLAVRNSVAIPVVRYLTTSSSSSPLSLRGKKPYLVYNARWTDQYSQENYSGQTNFNMKIDPADHFHCTPFFT